MQSHDSGLSEKDWEIKTAIDFTHELCVCSWLTLIVFYDIV
jgi:hypothetical protein